MSEEHTAIDDHEHEEHAEMNLYVIGGYLLMLTIATSATLVLQSFPNYWGPMTNILFVLMVSTVKASLVIGFFMHLFFEKVWKYFLMVPPCILGFTLVFALLPDVAYKPWPIAIRPY